MLKVVASACIAILFLLPHSQPAQAMSCDNKGAKDRLHYGSNVSGEKVTICAEYWWPPVVGKPAPVAPVPKKPVTPVKVQPNFFVVTPQKPYAFTSGPRTIEVGDEITVSTSAMSHTRRNVLLGRLAVVRFTPIRTSWSFGDRAKGIAVTGRHSFRSPGLFSVQALVDYSVKFRFVGSTLWINDPRGITLPTNPLAFRVRRASVKPKVGKPLLVLFDCLGIQRLGC